MITSDTVEIIFCSFFSFLLTYSDLNFDISVCTHSNALKHQRHHPDLTETLNKNSLISNFMLLMTRFFWQYVHIFIYFFLLFNALKIKQY